MKILAMDTSSVNATVAIADENRVWAEYTISNDRAHSQIIMPMLDEMMRHASLGMSDIDAYAVAIGPGSFTGLRIGMSVMKTLAQTMSKPFIGVSSLDSLAASFCESESYICPIIDARRNEVYNSLYFKNKKITDDRVVDLDVLLSELQDKKVIFAGDGAIKYKDKIKSFNNSEWYISPLNLMMQKASSVARIAIERAVNNDYDNLYDISPIYLRLSQAEREYNIAHGINE